MSEAAVVGWDVGGAHLKAASVVRGGQVCRVVQQPCELWRGLDRLDAAMAHATFALRVERCRHVLTMSGELVDLFRNRREGVLSVVAAMRNRLGPSVQVYAGEFGFICPNAATVLWDSVASANWMASAAWVATRVDQALFIDIGSTTTDVIPVRGGEICANGRDDYQRSTCDELIYTGVVRTPVMAVAQRVPFGGHWLSLMAEYFATMADVHRLCADLPAHADQMPTADGQGKTLLDSARRLARMVGRDVESASLEVWRHLARYLADVQLRRIHDACQCITSGVRLDTDAPVIGAGVGRFLAERVAQRMGRRYLDFSELFDATDRDGDGWLASCAPAVAVAMMAAEE